MNANWAYIQANLSKHSEYQSAIFEQGYLITNHSVKMDGRYPYFGNWAETVWNNTFFYIHIRQKLFLYESDGILYFLIGHAYDPFQGIADENTILKRVLLGEGLSQWEITLGEGARLQLVLVALAGASSRVDCRLKVSFEGEGANCSLKGLYLAGGESLANFEVEMVHNIPRCTSSQLFKGSFHGLDIHQTPSFIDDYIIKLRFIFVNT